MNLLLIIVIIVLGTYLIWKASELISVATDHLAYYYKVPSLVKGAIFVSLASSFPEFATVTLSTYFHHAFDLGVGTVVGSAVFNILLVPAFSQLAANKSLKAHRDIVYKEGFFYVIAIAVTFLIFFYSVTFDSADHLTGNITRGMALIPIALYAGYLYIQSREAKENGYDIENFEPRLSKTRTWINLLSGCFFVFLVCEAKIIAVLSLVGTHTLFGKSFYLSPILLGFTICAFVTSVPDSFFSIRDARKGEADSALANAFGSNVFDLLICIPSGILIAGIATININEVLLPMGFLLIATFLAIGIIRHNLRLTQKGSYALIGIYTIFLIWQFFYLME